MEIAIDARALTFKYKGQSSPIIDNVDFQLGEGRIAVITGPSGSGKSTLGYCLCGVIPKHIEGDYHGEVSLSGRQGIVFQDPESQIFLSTVEDEIAFAPENLETSEEEITNIIAELLQLTGLSSYRHFKPDKLSGGQKQLVAIAGVLAMSPEVIIMDEPLAQLDKVAKQKIRQVLQILKNQGKTIIIIEHDCSNLDIADEVWEIRDRKLRRIQQKLKMEPLDKPAATVRKGNVLYDDEAAIQCKDLVFRYKNYNDPNDAIVIDRVDLDLYKGQITALIGPNGAGKTTLGKLLTGILKPEEGQVRHFGEDVSSMPLYKIGRNVGYSFQNSERQLFAPTVKEEISFGLYYSGIARDKILDKTEELLDLFELSHLKDVFPMRLSWGEKKRLALAACMSLEPEYLILDEPTIGLDPERTDKLSDTLVRLEKKGIGILIISHNNVFIQDNAMRILAMEKGCIVDDSYI